jgi:mycothiol synthase
LPSGELVLRHVGAQLVMEQQFIQLDLSELKMDLLTHWITESEGKALDYRLWQNLGAYPPNSLAEIADLYDVMNSAPKGERDTDDQQTTPESLQEQDEGMIISGMQRLTSFVEHKSSNQLVAFSELYWDTKRATVVIQHATAVRPEHRRHSLGRWIKAANLQTALRTNPSARFVRAGNTDTNLGMLRINQALGFKPWTVHTDWQIETKKLESYLSKTFIS